MTRGKDKIRVLIVDDSAFMRMAVAKTINADERFEVIGQAKDGQDGVDKALELKPDVMTMDFNMPRLNGAQAVRAILDQQATPIVMLSAHTYDGAKETVEALSAGAVDFVTKPDGEVSMDLTSVADELLRKLRTASRAHPQPAAPAPAPKPRTMADVTLKMRAITEEDVAPRRSRQSFASAILDPACIIAISTGGPSALERVIPLLPESFGMGTLIVQHMPGHFTRALAERLDQMSVVTVREARPSERLVAGVVLIAPGDHHVVFEKNGMIKLSQGPPVNGCRPSADVTLQSAAPVYGAKLTTVVMTGMGRDGALGASAVKAAGGRIFAQDKETSVVYGMPKAVSDMGLVDDQLPLGRIAAKLARLRV